MAQHTLVHGAEMRGSTQRNGRLEDTSLANIVGARQLARAVERPYGRVYRIGPHALIRSGLDDGDASAKDILWVHWIPMSYAQRAYA